MSKFAFLINSANNLFITQLLDRMLARKTSSFKVFEIKNVRSSTQKEIQGYLIVFPLRFTQIQEQKTLIKDKIIAAVDLAKEKGASILGLGGYAAVFSNQGYIPIQDLRVPVTSGSTFTSWSIFEAIYRMSKVKKIDLKKSCLSVIGATNAIGSLCSRKFSSLVSKITLHSADKIKLERLKEAILHLSPVELLLEADVPNAVKDADIIIFTDDTAASKLNLEDVKPGTIVCNVSLDKRIATLPNTRQDITIINAGLVKMPYPTKLGIKTGLPNGIIWASLTETMLLTFEEKFSNYSLGEDINLDKMDEIADIAVKHGFEVWVPEAPL